MRFEARRLPANIELALYRIFQEALKNVEKRARARHVTVYLRQQGAFAQLVIRDDGVGFDSDSNRRKSRGGLGLLGMRERETYVGGTLKIKSVPNAGAGVEVRIPLPPTATAAS